MGGGVIRMTREDGSNADPAFDAFNDKLVVLLEQAGNGYFGPVPKGKFQGIGEGEDDGQYTITAAFKPEKGWGAQFSLTPAKDGQQIYDKVKESSKAFKDVEWTESPSGYPGPNIHNDVTVCGGLVPGPSGQGILDRQTVAWVQKKDGAGDYAVWINMNDGNAKDFAKIVWNVVRRLDYCHPAQ